MAQATEIIGGDDRNRTGVHGFAIRIQALFLLVFCVNGHFLFTTKYQ